MTISITKPTVGGSENTWGATVNTALDDVVDVLNGNTASTPDLTEGSWKVGGTAITATAAELNHTDGVSSNIQTQLNAKAPTASPTFTGTANIPTANVTTVDLGNWTISQSGSSLKFFYDGTARFALSSSGALTVENDVTAFGNA